MTATQHHKRIATELQISIPQVTATAGLLAEGATVPFISRYRKEMTGLLDEVQVTAIRELVTKFAELDKRRQAIINSLSERKLLTDTLKTNLEKSDNLLKLEDIYLPFKQKRKTRAVIAKERGLEPLALAIFNGNEGTIKISDFINPTRDISSAEEASAGARDIIAEWISENSTIRARLRKLFLGKTVLRSTVVKKNRESGTKFRDYFEWEEDIRRAAGHRILAMFRGEAEKVLRLSFKPPEDQTIAVLNSYYAAKNQVSQEMSLAMAESYKRLLSPSLEKELRKNLKEKADKEAIAVFGENLRELLLAPALGQKRVMALDPGFRTGAKLVCLDGQGRLLHYCTIYPTHGGKQEQEAGKIIREQCQKQRIQAIGIGNGTAGRETEQFIHSLQLEDDILITLVNESGASIYSASEVARKEFPDHDITVRGAVSIGRRLQDPLAELVKLDPKSIGVGQYQHDVNQTELKNGLEDVVVSCVNSVGVEVNSASRELLTYVSGLGPVLADNILSYRNEHGPFLSRKDLKRVSRLGAKAFEQCAGFLRIHGAKNPLDDSAVHPEQYKTVAQMASDRQCDIEKLISSQKQRDEIDIQQYVSDSLGLISLRDILNELAKPGRDPREKFVHFAFEKNVNSIDDLITEMRLPGIVTNVTRFGAFVDIGVHQDGLIHISQLANRFVRDPAEIVKTGQQVVVRILEVDKPRKRIALSLRDI